MALVAPATWVAWVSIRRVPVSYISVWRIGAATGAPDSARWMSLRISPADW